jgi:hypothetical protein
MPSAPPPVLSLSYGAFSCQLEGFDDPAQALRDILDVLDAYAGRLPGGDLRARPVQGQGGQPMIELTLHGDAASAPRRVRTNRQSLAGLGWDAAEGETPDVQRLLRETERHLSEPGGAERRKDFSHLRQAAETPPGAPPRPRDTPFRQDLAQSRKDAPLRLVPQQRVDPLDDVQRAEMAQFVAQLGVKSLPDLLHAAATFLTRNAARPAFSQRELIDHLRDLKSGHFHRDDSLRAFGQLLRAGKIVEAPHGGFTVPQDQQLTTRS